MRIKGKIKKELSIFWEWFAKVKEDFELLVKEHSG